MEFPQNSSAPKNVPPADPSAEQLPSMSGSTGVARGAVKQALVAMGGIKQMDFIASMPEATEAHIRSTMDFLFEALDEYVGKPTMKAAELLTKAAQEIHEVVEKACASVSTRGAKDACTQAALPLPQAIPPRVTLLVEYLNQAKRELDRELGFQSMGFQSLGFQSLGFQSLGFQSLGFQSFGEL